MRSLALSLLCVTASICAAVPSTATASPGAATGAPPNVDGAAIVRGIGQRKIEGARDWANVATGDVLTSGLTVQASPDEPLEMILPDGVTIRLEPGGQVHWMRASRLPTETNKWTRGYHLVLKEGELEVRMPPGTKGSHAFLVSTSAGTLTDWRGQLHVMVHDDSAAAAIYEGALVVGSNGQGFAVYDGAGIVMKKNIDPDKTRGIPAAPSWEGGGSFSVAPRNERATLDVGWSPVAGATSYRVEIATDPSMVRVVRRATTTTPHFTMPEPVKGGTYWAHVRAVESAGIVGEWSAAQPIRVVRYELPDGGFVAGDGAIVLPDRASLRLSEFEGMEAAYENVSNGRSRAAVPLYWSKLTGPLHIDEDSPMRIVHLRVGAGGPESQLVLARRQLRADVDMQPKNALWPLDPIDVRVVIEDPSGRMDGSKEQVTLSAMLDLTPLAVDWKKDGATWRARIPPQSLPGPSVIRVVAKDDRGTEIGRGFVELDTPSRTTSDGRRLSSR